MVGAANATHMLTNARATAPAGARAARRARVFARADVAVRAAPTSTGRARGPERMRGASPGRRGSGEPGGLAIDSHNFYSFRDLTR